MTMGILTHLLMMWCNRGATNKCSTGLFCLTSLLLIVIIVGGNIQTSSRHFDVVTELKTCEYSKLQAVATAYTAGYESTGKRRSHKLYGITSSGVKALQFHTIAMDSSVPFGTLVYIPMFKSKPNKGWFVVQDRGGAVRLDRGQKGVHKVDIYIESRNDALKFGRKSIEIYIPQNQGGNKGYGKCSFIPSKFRFGTRLPSGRWVGSGSY